MKWTSEKMKKRKRWRAPKPRPNELRILFGKLPNDSPDILYVWGEGTSRADSRLLHYMFSSKRYAPGSFEAEASFIEELEKRGYDIETLKFSIQKCQPAVSADAR